MIGDERCVDGIGDVERINERVLAPVCLNHCAVVCPRTAVQGSRRGDANGAVARAMCAERVIAVKRAIVLDSRRGPGSFAVPLVLDNASFIEDMADQLPRPAHIGGLEKREIWITLEEIVVAIGLNYVGIVCNNIAQVGQRESIGCLVDLTDLTPEWKGGGRPD